MNRWSDEFIHNRTKFKKEKGATCCPKTKYPKDKISERKINTVENIRQLINKTCYKIFSGKISAEKKLQQKISDKNPQTKYSIVKLDSVIDDQN